jgi:hypothetical protein
MNRKFELIIYDPDYSSTGHYTRYNKYFLKIFSSFSNIKRITYFGEKLLLNKKICFKKITNVNIYKGYHLPIIKKFFFFILNFFVYLKNIILLTKYGKNKTLVLLSESNFIFGLLFLLIYRYKYSIIVISTKPLSKKGFLSYLKYFIYISVLSKANFVVALNKINQKLLSKSLKKKVYFIPERYL